MSDSVLVTGAGGAAGVIVIQALRASGVRVVAADLDPLAVGLRLGDDRGLLPPYNAPDFVERLCELAATHKATALVTTMTEEMFVLSKARATLDAAGIAYWFSETEALENCLDKWRFAQVLSAAGLPHPATGLATEVDVPGPWIVKPRFGRGSRDVFAVEDPDDLPFVFRRVPDPIVQTKLVGREFTVDAMVGRDGELLGAVPRWRLETKAGISTKGETFSNTDVVAGVAEVLKAVGVVGAANVQGFVPADGPPSFIEINPRFSGALALSLAAGADLVGEFLRALGGEEPRPDRLIFRPGVVMLRHYQEIFEG
jgi:carbamoyl-phosphate synthase large subunit